MDQKSPKIKLVDAQPPDRRRWGSGLGYSPKWARRAELAASLVPDNVTVLEIGVGTGEFRELVGRRTTYVGADLQPLDAATLALDLDRDALPARQFDYAVLLGVLEYLTLPEAAVTKICNAADSVVISYCCTRTTLAPQALIDHRKRRGWLNSFDKNELTRLFLRYGHQLFLSMPFNAAEDFEQFIMKFHRIAHE